ncbi:notchless protein homolog 1-like [Saccoglossus kowalevskii]
MAYKIMQQKLERTTERKLFKDTKDKNRISDHGAGVLCRTLQGHGHWVNTLALSTDYVLRTGAYDPSKSSTSHQEEDVAQLAEDRYNSAKGSGPERLVSGSDDFTMYLWQPSEDKKSICRMTGHQQLINEVLFSPDTRIIASASFDKSVKLWDGKTGK